MIGVLGLHVVHAFARARDVAERGIAVLAVHVTGAGGSIRALVHRKRTQDVMHFPVFADAYQATWIWTFDVEL